MDQPHFTINDQLFRALIEHNADGIALLSAEGVILYQGPASKHILGFEPEEMMGRDAFEFIHPDDAVPAAKLFEQLNANPGTPVSSHMRFQHKDGTWRWLETTVSNMLAEPGVHAIVVNYKDFTLRKRAEDELSTLSQAVKQSNASIVITDPNGTIEYVNPFFSALTGYSFEEAVGLNPRILKSGFSQEEIYKELWNTILQGREWQGEFCNRKKNGELYWESASISPVVDSTGCITHFIAVKTDITERKRADQTLRESEAGYRLLAENMADVIWILNTQSMRFRYVSPSVERLRGFTPEEAQQQPLDQVVTPASLDFILRSLPQRLQDFLDGNPAATTQIHEVEQYRKDGSTVWTEIVSNLLQNERGEIEILGVSRDISERKLKDAEIQEVAKFPEQNPNPVLKVSADGVLIYANTASRDLLAYWETAVGQPLPDEWRRAIQEAFVGAAPVEMEEVTCTGRIYSLTLAPIADGGYVNLYGLDVTQRKQAEQVLREREVQYSAVIETSADGFWMTDMHGKILEVNQVYAQHSGYTRQELLEMRISDLEANESLEDTLAHLEQVMLAGSHIFESLHRTKDGKFWQVEINTTYLPIDGGRIFAFMRDIRQRKRTETLLKTRVHVSELAQSSSLDELLQAALDDAEICTASSIGFFHFVDPDQENLTLQTWSTHTLQVMCQAEGKGMHYPASQAGVWVDCLRTRTPVIHNDYASLPHKKGLPEGHAQVVRELTVPVLRDGLVMAIMGVGNKLTDYTQDDVEIVETLASLIVDMVVRKRAEKALLESERKYSALFDQSHDAIFIMDLQGRIRDANRTASHLLGYAPEEFVGLSPQNISTQKQQSQDVLERLLRGEHIPLYERIFRKKDGEPVPAEVNVELVCDVDGNPVHIQSSVRDIRERKRAEEDVRRRAEETTSLLKASQALTSLDLETTLQTIGAHAKTLFDADGCRIFLMEPDGKSLRCVLALQENPVAFTPLIVKIGEGVTGMVAASGKAEIVNDMFQDPRAVQVPGTPDEQEAIMFSPLKEQDHTLGVLSIRRVGRKQPFQSADLELLEAFASMAASAVSNARLVEQVQRQNIELEQRVTERTIDLSRANASLEQASRAKDEFLTSMSHELRTPLNAILTLAESLEEGIYEPLTERQLKPLSTISESGYHLLNLINDILDLSKIEAGKLELRLNSVEVEPLCQGSLRMVSQQALKKKLQVSFTSDPAVETINADARLLKQMLVNLLSNAVKFTPDGGQIGLVVRGDTDQHVVHFTVWDTGIGITPEHTQKLFRPFIQIDSGLDRQYGGTGLGLSLVYRMADQHGGSVSFESGPGTGSSFTFSLPWTAPGALPQTGQLTFAHMPNGQRKPLILIAEDNLTIQKTFSDYLSRKGLRVLLASNGIEAIECARDALPDLILMDVQMPKMDGLEATRRLRNHAEMGGIPIIAITALALPGERERCLEAGANDYLTKPVSLKHLAEIIQTYLKR